MIEDTENRTRVMLVADPEPGEPGLRDALRARGFEVATRTSIWQAVEALDVSETSAVLVALPLRDCDASEACAAVKKLSSPPVLILADASGSVDVDALPEELRPDAVISRPVEAVKLAVEIHDHLQGLGDVEDEIDALGVSVPELMLELHRRRASEVLEIRTEEVCTAIHLRDGEPVFAEGGSIQDTLGRMLLRKGTLDQDQYARVVQRMTEAVITHESLRMGEVLVELGFMTNAEVYDALALQVREKIVSCFQWERFAYELREPLESGNDLGIFQCPPMEALILMGIREHYGPARLEHLLAPLAELRPNLSAPANELIPRFELAPSDRGLLREVDGTTPLAELRGTDEDAVTTDQLIAALSLCAGFVYGERSAESSAPEEPIEATEAARPAAAAKPARRAPSPRRATDPLNQLRRRFARKPTPKPDERASRLQAEHAFNQGIRMLHEQLLPGALTEFKKAVELMPEEAEYRMLRAWIEFRLATTDDEKRRAGTKVRECVKRMLDSSRTSGRAHSILGQLANAEGNPESAVRHFKLAVRYDPDDAEAIRYLRLLHLRSGGTLKQS